MNEALVEPTTIDLHSGSGNHGEFTDGEKTENSPSSEYAHGFIVMGFTFVVGLMIGIIVPNTGNSTSRAPDGTLEEYTSAANVFRNIHSSVDPCLDFSMFSGSTLPPVPQHNALSGPAKMFLDKSQTMSKGHIAAPLDSTVIDVLARGMPVNGVSVQKYHTRSEFDNSETWSLIWKTPTEENSNAIMHSVPLKCRQCTTNNKKTSEEVPRNTFVINATCELYLTMLSRTLVGCQCCSPKTQRLCAESDVAMAINPDAVCPKFPLTVEHAVPSAVDHAAHVTAKTKNYTTLDLVNIALNVWPSYVTVPTVSIPVQQKTTRFAQLVLATLSAHQAHFSDATVLYEWHPSHVHTTTYEITPEKSFDDVIYGIDGYLAQLHLQDNNLKTTPWTINPFAFDVQYNRFDNTFYVSPTLARATLQESPYNYGVFAYFFWRSVLTTTGFADALQLACSPTLPKRITTDEIILMLGSHISKDAFFSHFSIQVKDYIEITPQVQFLMGVGSAMTGTNVSALGDTVQTLFQCSFPTLCQL